MQLVVQDNRFWEQETAIITVNRTPTLTGAVLAPVCVGSGATINLTGLLSRTSTVTYTINGCSNSSNRL
jgi:hypothetical protein